MDRIDQASKSALASRRTAYKRMKMRPTPESRAAYEQAFDAWRTAAMQQVRRQQPWSITLQRGQARVLKALGALLALGPHSGT